MVTLLGVDIGTTFLKIGVCQGETKEESRFVKEVKREYSFNCYNGGLFCDIEPEKWIEAFVQGCKELGKLVEEVDVIILSGTTPGLVPLGKDGHALCPAILMLDQRAGKQAVDIVDTVGIERLLEVTGNLPVAGGCSLASILWIKENWPDIYAKTALFGHSNTYLAGWLTGKFAIDPSSASLSALYNVSKNDFSWSEDIAKSFGIPLEKLPPILPSHKSVGRVTEQIAGAFGLKKRPSVVIGGNDAVLAAFSAGVNSPGDVINVNGTCEITMVCLPRCVASRNYNIRVHVVEGRWLTMRVMNAGGKAYEWFHRLFCREMEPGDFFKHFVKKAINMSLEKEPKVVYVPYLAGSRYSHELLTAEFKGLTLGTTREELFGAVVRSLCEYQREHLIEVSKVVPLKNKIFVAGGNVNPSILEAKKKWMGDYEYFYSEEFSSLRGALLLGWKYLESED